MFNKNFLDPPLLKDLPIYSVVITNKKRKDLKGEKSKPVHI